jgi:5-oxoprolinase (ATP-hydrolysing)
VAIAPDGTTRRVKVLSTSALRGRVTRDLGHGRLEIEPGWDDPGAPIVGLRFRALDRTGEPARVSAQDAAGRWIDVTPPPDRPLDAFELVSDDEAPILAARLLTRTPVGATLPRARIRLATTLGTNALLERRGATTCLFVTRGFGDLLRIGTQQRPELFRLDVARRPPLAEEVVEVDERLDARGRVLRPIDVEVLEPVARDLLARGVRSVAVALLHAYRNPVHEERLAAALAGWGFDNVSCSARVAPRIKILERAETAVADAYLAPVVGKFLDRVAVHAAKDSLLVLSSAGGLGAARDTRSKDTLLSGPAGGVVGAAVAARRAGIALGIAFDMGGTSTDVARFEGECEVRREHRVGDAAIAAPALAIESVAAGGGSVCRFDGERLLVGPESAGAHPGPACYGAGGPLTITDVNLLLGRIDPDRFGIPIDPRAAERRFDELQDALGRSAPERPAARALLEGIVAIADEAMAGAIRRISTRRGYDPAEHALVAFGGAGGQHACGVAERLGMRRILLPADSGLLSAIGLGEAVLERFAESQVLEPLEIVQRNLDRRLEPLEREARAAVVLAGVPAGEAEVRRRALFLRLAGQETSLEIGWGPGVDVRAAFDRSYADTYGHDPGRRPIEVEAVRVVVSSKIPPVGPVPPVAPLVRTVAQAQRRIGELPAFDRADLPPGATIDGPALILERHATAFVAHSWHATVLPDRSILLETGTGTVSAGTGAGASSAVSLELFTRRFTTLVEEMGERLERTAVSTNVKERLDFSCALLDPHGELVVNAPHIPVHLGALGTCVRAVGAALALGPGDVAVTNHPAFGGSHLPDVTVITPVFDASEPTRLLGYVASRAHHAEIGGTRPGSMPPDATTLVQEGVVLRPMLLVAGGLPRWDEVRGILAGAPWPSRAVDDNLADLAAAVAANHAGAERLRELAGRHGIDEVHEQMRRLGGLAAERVREALRTRGDAVLEAEERLDDGTPLRVRITIEKGHARFGFAGTGAVHPGNLNATPAIVRSVVLYVIRLLLPDPLPLNEGLLRAVRIDLPRGSLLDPPFGDDPRVDPAVVGGNVETSQRLVDTLLKALGLAASSQGTMNNVIFGNERYGYYETIGGGCGAGPSFDGPSGVHSHMSNTRITDVEVLEHRYPVRVERFALRRGSGGAGQYRGGDGLVREIVFLEPATLSVLTQHRVEEPYGVDGGAPGARGRQWIVRVAGAIEELGPIDGRRVEAGDRLIVETPGGGGWGHPI